MPSDRASEAWAAIGRTKGAGAKRSLPTRGCTGGGAWLRALLCNWHLLLLLLQSRKFNPAMGAASSSHVAPCEFVGETSRVKYGVYCLKSNHQKMEDNFSAIPDIDGTSLASFFGVYGGHGGADVSKYCAKQFPIEVLQHQEYQDAPSNALQSVFFRIDEIIEQSDEWREMVNPGGCTSCLKNGIWPFNQWPFNTEYGSEGTTACAVLIKGKEIIVGNVGDAQCLLSMKGQTQLLTQSHVPKDEDERERIEFAGGYVIGDYVFKQNKSLLPKAQIVTCEPSMNTVGITQDTEFLVIASNGLWKCLTHDHVARKVRRYLLDGETDLCYICKQVCFSAAKTYVMRDTMTMILVQFKKDTKTVSAQDKDNHKSDVEAEDPNPDMQGASDDEMKPLLPAS